MNFIQIVLTTKCQLTCWHCPMKDYRNTDNEPWVLTNERLIPFLEKNISPKDWVVELTGGEPALYKGIEELLTWLSLHYYRVLVKTNGLLPIEPHNGIKRVAAFHQLDNPPKYFDEYLIVDKIDREAKENYCRIHGIPYKVIGFNKERFDNVEHGFKLIAYVDPHGHQVRCLSAPVIVNVVNGVDVNTIEHKQFQPMVICKHCKAAVDAWRFL